MADYNDVHDVGEFWTSTSESDLHYILNVGSNGAFVDGVHDSRRSVRCVRSF